MYVVVPPKSKFADRMNLRVFHIIFSLAAVFVNDLSSADLAVSKPKPIRAFVFPAIPESLVQKGLESESALISGKIVQEFGVRQATNLEAQKQLLQILWSSNDLDLQKEALIWLDSTDAAFADRVLEETRKRGIPNLHVCILLSRLANTHNGLRDELRGLIDFEGSDSGGVACRSYLRAMLSDDPSRELETLFDSRLSNPEWCRQLLMCITYATPREGASELVIKKLLELASGRDGCGVFASIAVAKQAKLFHQQAAIEGMEQVVVGNVPVLDASWVVRMLSLAYVAPGDHSDALGEVLRFIGSEDGRARTVEAAMRVSADAFRDREFEKQIAIMLESDDEGVRAGALRMLGALGLSAHVHSDAVLKIITRNDRIELDDAAYTLGRMVPYGNSSEIEEALTANVSDDVRHCLQKSLNTISLGEK